MSEAKDTLYRQLTLLQLVPRYPGRIATPVLTEKLREKGFNVTERTVQRDLAGKISELFPVICHDDAKPYRWSFRPEAHINLPSLDTVTALTLYLSEQQLQGLLPQVAIDQLTPQFNKARQHLEHMEHNGLSRWAKRVRALPNGKQLISARINSNVWQSLTLALMDNLCLEVNYLSRHTENKSRFVLHPAGLVVRNASSYLVARVENYDDLRQFALHRIQSAKVLQQPADIDDDFDIDAYIAQGAFTGGQGQEQTELVADIAPYLAWMLKETPLSQHQDITPLNDGSDWHRLVASVPMDWETLWWVYAMNSGIRLFAPDAWVDDLKDHALTLQKFYLEEAKATLANKE